MLAVNYQHTDMLGSPVAVTNASGQVTERNDYEPYGAIIGKPNRSGIGYTGHVMDGGTALTYMQQRYYDQSVGRFLSVDPITAVGSGEMRFFNRYRYADGNPYRFNDPDGRSACDFSPTSCGSKQPSPEDEKRLDVWGDRFESLGLRALQAYPVVRAASWLYRGWRMLPEWSIPRAATDKIPKEWGKGMPNRKGEGHRWQDPTYVGRGVRIDRGDPNSPNPSQRVDHVVVIDGGKVLGRDGKPLPGNGSIKNSPEQAHIPLSEWLKWTSWNKP